MIKFRGRLAFRQYMAAKLAQYGIKVWIRSDSTNGFNKEFQIYTGKVTGRREVGLDKRDVLDLSRKIWNVDNNVFKFWPIPTAFWEWNKRQRDSKNKSQEVSNSASFQKCCKEARTIPDSSAWGIHSCCLDGRKAYLGFVHSREPCRNWHNSDQEEQKWGDQPSLVNITRMV